ncbi:TolC family protein [Sulfurimonas sp.]
MKKSILSLIAVSTMFSLTLTAEDIVAEKAQEKKQSTLDQLIVKTLSDDPTLKQQKFQVQIGDLELKKQWGDWLPTLDLTASTGRENIVNPDNSQTWMNMNQGKLDLKQLIYDFKIDSEIDKKQLDLDIANLTFEQTKQNILYRNIVAYFNVIKEYKQLENSMNNQTNVGKQLVAEDKKSKAGKGNKTDLLQVQAVYQRSMVQVNTARTELTNSIANYYRNFYAYPVKVTDMKLPVVPYDKLPKQKDEASEIALSYNPQLIKNNMELEKIKLDRTIDIAKFLPKIEFQGKLESKSDVSGINGHKDENYAKVELTYNIFNGGKDSIDLELNSLKRMQQKQKILDEQNAYKERASVAWERHFEALKNYENALKEVEYYDEFVMKIDKQRELGKANMLDVLDAKSKQLDAQTLLVETQTTKDLSVYALLLEMGQLESADIKTVE